MLKMFVLILVMFFSFKSYAGIDGGSIKFQTIAVKIDLNNLK